MSERGEARNHEPSAEWRKRWFAPWTDEQVAVLATYQSGGRFHPYTCGNDSTHPVLVPTRGGWRCEACDYKQEWAHGWHA